METRDRIYVDHNGVLLYIQNCPVEPEICNPMCETCYGQCRLEKEYNTLLQASIERGVLFEKSSLFQIANYILPEKGKLYDMLPGYSVQVKEEMSPRVKINPQTEGAVLIKVALLTPTEKEPKKKEDMEIEYCEKKCGRNECVVKCYYPKVKRNNTVKEAIEYYEGKLWEIKGHYVGTQDSDRNRIDFKKVSNRDIETRELIEDFIADLKRLSTPPLPTEPKQEPKSAEDGTEVIRILDELNKAVLKIKSKPSDEAVFKCARCGHNKKFWSVKNDAWYCDQCKHYVEGQ